MNAYSDVLGRILAFLLPEAVSLKVVFDNVRNALIASALVTGGFWVKNFAASQIVRPPEDSLPYLALLSGCLVWFGFFLFTLNLLQVVAISDRSRTAFVKGPRALRWIAAVLVGAILALIQFTAISVFSLAILRGAVGAP